MSAGNSKNIASDKPDAAEVILRKAGMKATRQRLAVFRELAGSDEHPDAETIFRRVRDKVPDISVDTVYRTLHSFEQAGLAVRIGPALERARFDACLVPHHHFVCEKCGSIIDFIDQSLVALPTPDIVKGVGSVRSSSYVLRGVCLRCEKASREAV